MTSEPLFSSSSLGSSAKKETRKDSWPSIEGERADLNTSPKTSIRLRGVAIAGWLLCSACLSPAQTVESAKSVMPEAGGRALAGAPELPSAPVPNLELAQNATSSSHSQPEQQNQDQQNQQPQKQAPQNQRGQQPSNEPSLGDLGFTPQQTQPNAELQAMLDKHTHMLKVHQRLGLITVLPMTTALITGPMAKAKGRNGQTIKEPTQTNLDLHAALGGATAALYFTTAYYAAFAPKIPGVKRRGAIRLHRALAFVHGPGMIATPILGAMAFRQEQDGEKVHGIASAHGAVAWATVAAYGAAIVSVSWPIKVHF